DNQQGARGSRLAFRPVRYPWQGAGRSRGSGRAKQPQHHRLDLRTQVGAGIAGHHDRSAHRRSRSAAVAVHRPARRAAGGRGGVLEMPQEAAESTAQMRKVIVDQIEALAELNRIVAHHGRGLDVVSEGRSNSHREEEPMLVAASGRGAPRMRDGGSASNLPPPDLGGPSSRRTEAPPVSPASADQGRDGWLSDLLNRTDAGA